MAYRRNNYNDITEFRVILATADILGMRISTADQVLTSGAQLFGELFSNAQKKGWQAGFQSLFEDIAEETVPLSKINTYKPLTTYLMHDLKPGLEKKLVDSFQLVLAPYMSSGEMVIEIAKRVAKSKEEFTTTMKRFLNNHCSDSVVLYYVDCMMHTV